MNQQVKKIIKASFCPKQKWVADDAVKNCFKCNNKFHALRRKHHCRCCGQIFCSECSNFYLNGKDIGETQKSVRVCQSCHQKCWKYIVKHDQSYLESRKSGKSNENVEDVPLPQNLEQLELSKSHSITKDQKLNEIKQIIDEYGFDEVQSLKILQKSARQKFSILLQVILKQSKIPLKYLNQIKQVIYNIDKLVPPNSMITENMNISQNLQIKCFFQQKEMSLKLESGILIKKKFVSKKVLESYQKVRCILVFGGLQSQDLNEDKSVSFQTIVQNRMSQMGRTITICKNLKIDIIFIEGGIEKQFEDMLANASITVISKVKVEALTRLKTVLQIEKILLSISEIENQIHEDIIGLISKMETINYKSIKQGNPMKKYFFIPTEKPSLGLTLFITGSDQIIIDKVKKEIKLTVLLYRHINLKTYKVSLDQSLLQSMPENIKNDCYLHNSEIFFSLYSEHHSDILNYLKQKYLTYKHISYVQSNFGNYPQVTKLGLEEYLSNRTHSFQNKWDQFTEICGAISDRHQIYYSEDDNPMGAYILKKLTNLDKKCKNCCKPNYMHMDLYYSTDQYVKIWCQSRIIQPPTEQQDYYFQSDDHNQLELVFDHLMKSQVKKKLSCHIECYQCQQILSAKINLKKEHLEYSVLAFLNHMFKGSTQTFIRENNERNGKINNKNGCSHKTKVRIFELGDKSLKILVGKYTISRQCVHTLSGRENFLKAKAQKFSLQKCILQSSKLQKISVYMFEQLKTIAESSKNSNFQNMIKDPKSSFIKTRSSIIGNVRLSQAQCMEMILPELIQEVTKVKNIAQIMLHPKRVHNFLQAIKYTHIFMNLMKRMCTIILQVKKSVKKRDLDMKYQTTDFDNDCFMEDIDMNSVLDSSSIQMSESEITRSQISKGQLYSHYQKQENQIDMAQYDWLQPIEQQKVMSRHDRKTQYNVMGRKSMRISEQDVFKHFKEISSSICFESGTIPYVPCMPHRHQSLIASALNSQIHKNCIQSSHFVGELSVTIKHNSAFEIIIENQQIKKLEKMIYVQEGMFGIEQKKIPTNCCEVTFLYPNQFQNLRRKKHINLDLFITSIAGADNWLASGGKSGSPFMRSFNDLLVIKKINAREFYAFKKFLPEYFNHLHNGSLLTPIYSAIIVNKDSNPSYYLVMQNLFFGMKEWYLYDFKGSVARRFSKPPTIPLDINFIIDRNSQPIFCKDNVLKNLVASLDYLVNNNIVDYSLILVVQIEHHDDYYMDGNRFQIGIVDYMRQFGTGEKIQNMWKGSEATVQSPNNYRDRMLRNLKKYFNQIPL